MVKILDSNYLKVDLERVANNTTQMNAEYKTQLLGLIKDFEDFFDEKTGDWDTNPVDLELNPRFKKFHCKYYLVHRINKEHFCRRLECLLKIVVITMIQQSQYGTPIFIISDK